MIQTTEDRGNSCFPNFHPWLSVLVSKCEHLNKQKTAGQQTGYLLLEPTLRPGGEGCHAIHSIPSCQMTVASWLLLHQPVDSCQFASYQLQECSSSLTWTLVITGPRQQLLGQPTEWPAYKFSRVDNGYLTRHKTSHRSTTWEPMIISCWTLTDL